MRKAKLAISWYFFAVGMAMGNWAAILPFVKELQGINNGVLGGLRVGAVGGAMLALPVVTYSNEHFGCGISVILGSLSMVLLFPLVALDAGLGVFALGIIMLGFGMGCTDVSMNGQAVLCEKITRTPILGMFHSIASIGTVVGALVGGAIMQQGISVLHEVAFICFILILPEFIFSCWLFSFQEEKLINQSTSGQSGHVYEVLESAENPALYHPEYRTHSEELLETERTQSDALQSISSGRQSDRTNSQQHSQSGHSQSSHTEGNLSLNNGSNPDVPSTSIDSRQTDWQVYSKASTDGEVDYITLLKLCGLCFIAYFGEGSIGDWSAIYLKDNLNSNAFECTLGVVGFQLFVAIGRFYSDYVVVFLGRQRLLLLSGIVSGAGLGITVIAPIFTNDTVALVIAIIGFSLCGAGMSVVAPSVISMAGAGISGLTTSAAIAYVSSIGKRI